MGQVNRRSVIRSDTVLQLACTQFNKEFLNRPSSTHVHLCRDQFTLDQQLEHRINTFIIGHIARMVQQLRAFPAFVFAHAPALVLTQCYPINANSLACLSQFLIGPRNNDHLVIFLHESFCEGLPKTLRPTTNQYNLFLSAISCHRN